MMEGVCGKLSKSTWNLILMQLPMPCCCDKKCVEAEIIPWSIYCNIATQKSKLISNGAWCSWLFPLHENMSMTINMIL
jgi:hypothetical protein